MSGSFVFPDGGSYEGEYLATGTGVVQRRLATMAVCYSHLLSPYVPAILLLLGAF